MQLTQILQMTSTRVPECVAAGFIDIASGVLLSMRTSHALTEEMADLIASATSDMFNGPNISAIERMFRSSRGGGDSGRSYFQEIVVHSDHLVHIFMRGQEKPEYAAVFVCRRSVNLGMALTRSRLVLPELEAAV